MLISACAYDEAARYYGDINYPERKPSEVEILTAAPASDYTVIADIQANRSSARHMQRRAAKIGADAILLVYGGGSYNQCEIWAGVDGQSHTYTRLMATCIVYK